MVGSWNIFTNFNLFGLDMKLIIKDLVTLKIWSSLRMNYAGYKVLKLDKCTKIPLCIRKIFAGDLERVKAALRKSFYQKSDDSRSIPPPARR